MAKAIEDIDSNAKDINSMANENHEDLQSLVKSVCRINDSFKEFAEKIDAPVCETLMGKGAYDNTRPRYTGMLGMHGILVRRCRYEPAPITRRAAASLRKTAHDFGPPPVGSAGRTRRGV